MKMSFINKFKLLKSFGLAFGFFLSLDGIAGRSVSIPAIAIYEEYYFTKGDNLVSAFVNPLPANLEGWQALCPDKGYNATTNLIPGSTTPASPGVPPVPSFPTIQECGRGVRNDDLLFGADAILILSNISSVAQSVSISITNPPNIDPSFGNPGTGLGTGTLLPGDLGLFVGCVQGGTFGATPAPYHNNTVTTPWSTGNSVTAENISIGPGETFFCLATYSFGHRTSSPTYLDGTGLQKMRFFGVFRLDVAVAENLGAITANMNVTIGPNSRLMDVNGKNPDPVKSYSVDVNGGSPF